jgi:hypothetical protein
VSPVIVAPESLVVNVPETPVILETLTVSPLIVAPLSNVVYTPETLVILVALTVVPVIVVPENVPVTLTVDAN